MLEHLACVLHADGCRSFRYPAQPWVEGGGHAEVLMITLFVRAEIIGISPESAERVRTPVIRRLGEAV